MATGFYLLFSTFLLGLTEKVFGVSSDGQGFTMLILWTVGLCLVIYADLQP